MKRFIVAVIAMHGLCWSGEIMEKSKIAILAFEIADEMIWRGKR